MTTPLVMIPFTLEYLGEERFGLWMTMSSIVVMLAFSDLGLGNSLITALGRSDGEADRKGAVGLISSTVAVLVLVALLVVVLALAIGPSIDWQRVFNASNQEGADAARTVVVVSLLCFAVGLPLSVIQKIQAAYQEGFQANLWQCLSSILSMFAVILTIRFDWGLGALVVAFMGTPVIVNAINGIVFFGFLREWLLPRPSAVDISLAKKLLRPGLGFVLISVFTSIGQQCDNLILAHNAELSVVAHYAVPFRLASMLSMVSMILYQPLWGANSEALARGDLAWVKKQTARFQILSVSMTALGAVTFVIIGPCVIRVWMGSEFPVSRITIAGLAITPVLYALAGPWFMVLNAAGKIRVQVGIFAIFTCAVVLAKIFSARTVGVAGVPWAQALCYGVIVVPVLRVTIAKYWRSLQSAFNTVPVSI